MRSKLRTLKTTVCFGNQTPVSAKQGPLEVWEEWRSGGGWLPHPRSISSLPSPTLLTPTKALPWAAVESTLSFSNIHRTSLSHPSWTWHHLLLRGLGFSPFFSLVPPALRAKPASFRCYHLDTIVSPIYSFTYSIPTNPT